jgi:hypothetical protein
MFSWVMFNRVPLTWLPLTVSESISVHDDDFFAVFSHGAVGGEVQRARRGEQERYLRRRPVSRSALRPADRAFLAAASRLLPRTRWRSFFVTPETLNALHRHGVA